MNTACRGPLQFLHAEMGATAGPAYLQRVPRPQRHTVVSDRHGQGCQDLQYSQCGMFVYIMLITYFGMENEFYSFG